MAKCFAYSFTSRRIQMYKDGDMYAELVCDMKGNVHRIYWDVWKFDKKVNEWEIHESLIFGDLHTKYPKLVFVNRKRNCIHFRGR